MCMAHFNWNKTGAYFVWIRAPPPMRYIMAKTDALSAQFYEMFIQA